MENVTGRPTIGRPTCMSGQGLNDGSSNNKMNEKQNAFGQKNLNAKLQALLKKQEKMCNFFFLKNEHIFLKKKKTITMQFSYFVVVASENR